MIFISCVPNSVGNCGLTTSTALLNRASNSSPSAVPLDFVTANKSLDTSSMFHSRRLTAAAFANAPSNPSEMAVDLVAATVSRRRPAGGRLSTVAGVFPISAALSRNSSSATPRSARAATRSAAAAVGGAWSSSRCKVEGADCTDTTPHSTNSPRASIATAGGAAGTSLSTAPATTSVTRLAAAAEEAARSNGKSWSRGWPESNGWTNCATCSAQASQFNAMPQSVVNDSAGSAPRAAAPSLSRSVAASPRALAASARGAWSSFDACSRPKASTLACNFRSRGRGACLQRWHIEASIRFCAAV
mmetsp:Transcript_148595/g.477073  ORF Transcript_148595/g.477073 Transcript_148595/m.477073 type:complete len:303 (+) Transcript_148595:881-1789(+)